MTRFLELCKIFLPCQNMSQISFGILGIKSMRQISNAQSMPSNHFYFNITHAQRNVVGNYRGNFKMTAPFSTSFSLERRDHSWLCNCGVKTTRNVMEIIAQVRSRLPSDNVKSLVQFRCWIARQSSKSLTSRKTGLFSGFATLKEYIAHLKKEIS